MPRRVVLSLLLVTLSATACSRRQPPQQQAAMLADTAGQGQMALDARERARQDSIARAEAERARLSGMDAERTARVRAILEEMVFFDYDDSSLRRDAQEVLARKVTVLRANPGVALRIDGHADERGSVEYNHALGMRRANSVREYLTGFGIEPNRLDIMSFGEDRPMDPRSSETAWARNRRAEFQIVRGGDNLVEPGR